MFLSQEKIPLKVTQPSDKGAADAGDEENPYLRSGPPPPAPPPSLRARVAKEASSRWYLWAALAFATLLVGGMLLAVVPDGTGGSWLAAGRARVGLPTLAIRNNAAEACATECADASAELVGNGAASAAAAASLMSAIEGETSSSSSSDASANVDDAYATCYAKCVAQETKDVVQEHEQFVREEKEIAAEEEKAAAAEAMAAATEVGVSTAASHHHTAASTVDAAKTQEDKELEALLEEVLDSMP